MQLQHLCFEALALPLALYHQPNLLVTGWLATQPCVIVCVFLEKAPFICQQPNICQDAKIVKWPLFMAMRTTTTQYLQSINVDF